MKTNTKAVYSGATTGEGGIASKISDLEKLKRSVLSCFLWEDEFYEDGEKIGKRISDLAQKVNGADAVALMKQASREYKLRHAPLLLATSLLRSPDCTPDDIDSVITRADSIPEILSIYWKDGKKPIPHKLRNALAKSFAKFDEYSLAKYDRDNAIKLKDVLRLVRPKPANEEQSALWKRVKERTLATPHTWENELSAGKDKKATWENFLLENTLGDLAFLRNLRNMEKEGVKRSLIEESLMKRKWGWILPYQFITAEKYAPEYSALLDAAMQKALKNVERLRGRTSILIDVSGSMSERVSAKSELTRWDAAVSLAMLLEGVCDDLDIFQFNTTATKVEKAYGFALKNKIRRPSGGTRMWDAIRGAGANYDRVIVITDEQTADNGKLPDGKANYYILNVASNENGVGYSSRSVHISGFSEASVKYITELESMEA